MSRNLNKSLENYKDMDSIERTQGQELEILQYLLI